MVKDLVCGMGVEEDDPGTFVRTFRGTTLYFCSAECMMLFSKHPDDYRVRTAEEPGMARDLVCGMAVDANNAPASSVFQGTTYYFCCSACRQKFEGNPKNFLAPKADPAH